MGYVESNLGAGEHVVHRAELHKIIYLPGILLLPLWGLGILLLIAAYVAMISTEMAVTNKRVIIKVGLISTRTIEMNLNKIENIGVDQDIIGKMFNYGTVTIVGTGGTREPFKHIVTPFEFRKAVQAQAVA